MLKIKKEGYVSVIDLLMYFFARKEIRVFLKKWQAVPVEYVLISFNVTLSWTVSAIYLFIHTILLLEYKRSVMFDVGRHFHFL